jgi:hypothetical protein
MEKALCQADHKAALVGRRISVPRDVFAIDIERGASQEPPDGVAWRGEITEYKKTRRAPFTIVIEVWDDDLELQDEPQQVSLKRIREWIDLNDGEARDDIGEAPKIVARTLAASTVQGHDVSVQTPTSR